MTNYNTFITFHRIIFLVIHHVVDLLPLELEET
jgi:hypothetical protein